AGAVAVRVGIFLGGTPVRGPTGVADTVEAVNGGQANSFFQVAQLPGGAPDLEFSVLPDDGHASRVIAAVFQALEPVENQRHNFFWSDVSDYPIHGCLSLVLCKWSLAQASAKRLSVAHSRVRVCDSGYGFLLRNCFSKC